MSLKYVGKLLLNLFYPPTCPLCEQFVTADGVPCDSCKVSLQILEADADLPHLPVKYIDRCVSCFAYDGYLRRAVHAFKYQQRLEQVKFFSGAIRGRISKLGDIDLIIPVPMHRRKLRSRGYNQAALLAQLLGEQTGSRVLVSALRRVRNDKAQMELERKERLRNVRSAFAISNKIEKLLKGRSVLLIDDVVTTGATINECARVLKKSGASKVQATTVARTLG